MYLHFRKKKMEDHKEIPEEVLSPRSFEHQRSNYFVYESVEKSRQRRSRHFPRPSDSQTWRSSRRERSRLASMLRA